MVVRMRVLRMAAIAGLLLGLPVGCADVGEGGAINAPFAGIARTSAVESMRMVGRQITVQGPQGYCIDKATKHAGGNGDFVLLGTCAAISGNQDAPRPRINAVLSVSVLKVRDGAQTTPEALKTYFAGATGQAALAQSGDGANVSLLASRVEGRVLILQANDTSPSRSAKLADTYWRAMFSLNGHLVSLTVSGLDTYPISQNEGQALIRSFVKSMQNANPVREKANKGLLSLFNRLPSGN